MLPDFRQDHRRICLRTSGLGLSGMGKTAEASPVSCSDLGM